MPLIRHQEPTRAKIGDNRLLVTPAAAPAILLWMQSESGGISLPADDKAHARTGLRVAVMGAVLCGGLALASMLPPMMKPEVPQVAMRTHSINEHEAAERQKLQLAGSSEREFDRDRDLGEAISDTPPITLLEEPTLDAALGSLPPLAHPQTAPETKPGLPEPRFAQEFWRTIGQTHLSDAYAAYLGRYSWKIIEDRPVIDFDLVETKPRLPEPRFAQEFWRTIGQTHLSDAYAAYLGRYSWKIVEEQPVIDLDLEALAQIDAEEMKRFDARGAEASVHVSLRDIPIPRRAPRAGQVKRSPASKVARCRNRIWRCPPTIAPMAQGSVQRLRSRPN
jgi:hypothetical protein